MVRYNFPKYEIELDISTEVYFPAEDTFFLLDSLILNDSTRLVFEIGGGSGIISIILAKKYNKTRFLTSDISPLAAEMINSNCILNSVTNQIDVICMDKLQAVKHTSPDMIIWNPPYLPIDEETSSLPIIDRLMLSGGEKGYEEVYELIQFLKKEKIKTEFYTIFSSITCNKEQINNLMNKGINVEILRELKLFFEKLYLVKFTF